MVRLICNDIIKVFDEVGEKNWRNAFQELLNTVDSTDKLKSNLRQMYGGMGSFNDVVLYSNGKPCLKENKKLADLRKKLFLEITR